MIGASIGFPIAIEGFGAIRWFELARILICWTAAPVAAALLSLLIHTLISKTITCKLDPLRHGLKALPVLFGVTVFIFVIPIVVTSSRGKTDN